MIRIDHLSFEFVATDEQFAQGLYANWDSFCRTCVEKVMEECLSVYDKEKVLYEIERLDLNLGSIPQEYFYREFPRKLREELQRALPLLNISAGNREESTDVSRLENLLFYLEHGYPKVEWSDKGFNLTEELEWIATQPATCIHKISKLCLSKEHILRRLLWQADNEAVLLRLYAAALTEPAASLYEKRSFLIMFLETKPNIPVRFIHEAENETRLQEMSELLDTLSIRQIMDTECREHTEVDLPPYWHYLYEWLIRYYPFNGLAIFGSKGDFIHHLHHRLLTFIRKRSYSFYFSKAELTLGFLLEIFGPVYYIEVLNAIYNLQPHHSDGSPVHDNYYNLELYRTFLNLSLLHWPLAKEGKDTALFGKENIHSVIVRIYREIDSNIVHSLLESCWSTDDGFISWLEDQTVSSDNKRELLQKMAVEKPLYCIHLFRKQAQESKVVPLLSACLSAPLLLQSMAQVDSRQASVLSRTIEWIQNKINDYPFLTGGSTFYSTALSQALLLYMQDTETLGKRTLTEKDTIHKFLSYLHFVYTGKYDYQEKAEWSSLSDKISTDMQWDNGQDMQEKEIADILHKDMGDTVFRDYIISIMETQPEQIELSDSNLPEGIRKKKLYRFISSQPQKLLDYVRQSVAGNVLPLDKWLEILEPDDWMRLATSLSLSQAVLLQQIITYLSESGLAKKEDLQQALATYLIRDTQKWIYNSKEETVHSFVQSLPTLQDKVEAERNKIEHNVKQILNIMEERSYFNEEEQREVPNNFFITNAGLCLFTPWFPRLFIMLDYLDKDKKVFKDTASQIRAVFLLQYLTCLEEKTYQEMELMFNRLLVDLPMHIPLPKQLELTSEEKNTAESMLKAVKANWSKMNGTSMKGFLETFIHRNGRLEQQEKKWLLTIEDRGYDILLASVPWSFKQMRYPWLEKYIEVIWHDKHTF